MNADIQHLATQLYSPIFAERDTISQAYEDALKVAHSRESTAAITAAIHVLMNTIAVEIEKRNNTPRIKVVATGQRHVDPEATEDEQSRRMGL